MYKPALQSVLVSIDTIMHYNKGARSADDFYHDQKSFDACMIHFITIGEMLGRIDDSFKKKHPEIPWRDIIDFRNLVAHNYFGIDAEEIWDIIHNHLPDLKSKILSAIESL